MRWLSLPALTADLRRAAADQALAPPLRQAAAAQLARLASAGVRGAHPRYWYQLTALSDPGMLAAPADGVLAELRAKAGEQVSTGQVLAVLQTEG